MSNGMFKNIVSAVSGSATSIHAAMYSIILAKQYSLKLKFVFVVDTASVNFLTESRVFVTSERDSYISELNSDGKRYLDYVASLAASKGVKVEIELRSGGVWSEIIRCSDEFKADMIIIGGKENLQNYLPERTYHRTIHTTTRTEIVEYAHCPVLVVHKPDIEALFKIL